MKEVEGEFREIGNSDTMTEAPKTEREKREAKRPRATRQTATQRVTLAAKAEAERRAAESEQRVAELDRVLDETAASHEELKQTHAATLDELAWYKRWAFGRRRERFTEGKGQGHLFELELPSANDLTGGQ